MKITISGAGYVGLVTAACLADVGNEVVCFDIDKKKIDQLNKGISPIHELGLEDKIKKNQANGRLSFTNMLEESIQFGDIHFIAVGTPPNKDGSANLSYVKEVAKNIGKLSNKQTIAVIKSTVPVGTASTIKEIIDSTLSLRKAEFNIPVISNPEFLKEGVAIEDFLKPDRIIIGSNNIEGIDVVKDLYAPFNRNHNKIIIMDSQSAELTKYASNAMLASRISLMNELANISERVGANIERVRVGVGSDSRIGYDFLYSGCGFGGSCFPKDVDGLIKTASSYSGLSTSILEAVQSTNENQKLVLLNKITKRFGDELKDKKFAIWGLSFKPGTDDMRSAPSIKLINGLIDLGAEVVAYDPVAMDNARDIFLPNNNLNFSSDALSACKNSDALVILTEWQEFRSPDFEALGKLLKNRIIFDGRNLYDAEEDNLNSFEYYSIGRPNKTL